jgi:hypothetical protein
MHCHLHYCAARVMKNAEIHANTEQCVNRVSLARQGAVVRDSECQCAHLQTLALRLEYQDVLVAAANPWLVQEILFGFTRGGFTHFLIPLVLRKLLGRLLLLLLLFSLLLLLCLALLLLLCCGLWYLYLWVHLLDFGEVRVHEVAE